MKQESPSHDSSSLRFEGRTPTLRFLTSLPQPLCRKCCSSTSTSQRAELETMGRQDNHSEAKLITNQGIHCPRHSERGEQDTNCFRPAQGLPNAIASSRCQPASLPYYLTGSCVQSQGTTSSAHSRNYPVPSELDCPEHALPPSMFEVSH